MTMVMKEGICRNNRPGRTCEKALKKEVQRVPDPPFLCSNSECGSRLFPVSKRSSMPWPLIAIGVAGLAVLTGVGYLAYSALKNPDSPIPDPAPAPVPITDPAPIASPSACPHGNLDTFLMNKPSADQLLTAGKSCRDAATAVNNAELVALAARLCRAAGDAGKAEGALCLGELYDPKEIKPGRLGQMPAADFVLAFDNYRRAVDLGSNEAQTRLPELCAFMDIKARNGDQEASRLLAKCSR